MELSRVLLYARTIRHLGPAQVAHRLRLRAQRRVVRALPGPAERVLGRQTGESVGWPAHFTPIDAGLAWPTLADVEAGELSMLGQTRRVGTPVDWRQAAGPQLWRFHLHYWDWAWGLAQEPDRERARTTYQRLIASWRDQTPFGVGDGWSPYVVALRAWSWCGQYDALAAGGHSETELADLLRVHAGYLRAHLELDVGGNHLVKDLKALIGLAVFFNDEATLRRALRRLERQVTRQVLADGGHFERAPAYHCQVLGDFIDLQGLLASRCPDWLSAAVENMRRWLGTVLLPDGTVPLLNDGFPVQAQVLARLRPGPRAPHGLTVLPDTGLAVLRRGDWHVLADIGLPSPNELPAHAHADTFGFLCFLGSRPVVVERGTSTYEPGDLRDFERSTAAHSTVEVDGANSTEVWGAFRAARRAHPRVSRIADDGTRIVLAATHDGYRRLPGRPLHTRSWTLSDVSLLITDEVTGEGVHEMRLRLWGTSRAAVRRATGSLAELTVQVAAGWERLVPSTCLEHVARATLPWRFEVELASEETA